LFSLQSEKALTTQSFDTIHILEVYPSEMALITSWNPTGNYGGYTRVHCVHSDTEIYYEPSYIKFNLKTIKEQIPNAKIVSAKLQMYPTSVVGSDYISAYFCSDNSWNENTITWNNQPTSIETLSTDTQLILNPTGVYYYFDITRDGACFLNSK
jgi:hypothetical protein